MHYVADGVQSGFTYPFPIFAEADLEVRIDGLVQASGFVVAGAGASEGGAVAVEHRHGARAVEAEQLVGAGAAQRQDGGAAGLGRVEAQRAA